METNTSKAQLAVWEWKEKAYESVKHLPILEKMRVIHEQTKQAVEQINKAKAALRQSGHSPNPL